MLRFGLLVILVLLPLDLLSGATREHSLRAARTDAAGADHPLRRVEPGDPARGAGLDVVWRLTLALLGIGRPLFGISLARFGKASARVSHDGALSATGADSTHEPLAAVDMTAYGARQPVVNTGYEAFVKHAARTARCRRL